MDLDNIKLIIWDLDETFWDGTISEEAVRFVPEHIRFLKDTTDIGIVNSICSKNDYASVEKCLKEAELWEYFVFSSIDWTPKGQRIKKIIETMKLRPKNVLFIDDNIQNLEEAKHFCPEIMTALPDNISELVLESEMAEKKDLQHKRLVQYKQLEEKEEARTDFSSNEEFLRSCNIVVDVCYECQKEVERIHELLMRSNQLNYTKFRQDKDSLIEVIENPDVKTGFVKVQDKFGDYGIVGFFAVKNNELIHYAFSCRTLGMKIEQYIYHMLGCPKLNVVGEVVAELNENESPDWINNGVDINNEPQKNIKERCSKKILFKGPCDMSQMYAFLNMKENAVTEFTYTNDVGISIEGHNHTSQIVTALYASEERKREIINEAEFFDKGMLSTALESNDFDFVVLSMLTDGNLGVYRRKETGEEIAFCEKKYNITDVKNRKKYVNGEIFTSFIDFTDEMIESFKEKYEFVENSDWEVTISNLQKIWQHINSETKIVLLLGSEREFKKKSKESYLNRHVEHAQMNIRIKRWAEGKNNVILLSFDDFIKSDADFIDTINHFTKRVYYDLACELANIFSDEAGFVEVKNKTVLLKESLKQKLKLIKRRFFN